MCNRTGHAIYAQTGPDERLRFKGALIMQHPEKEDHYLTQFDARHLPEAFGWHAFPKNLFINIEFSEIE